MTTLYILRHGETELNRQHIVQGRGIDAPLNEKGMQQAAQFYKRYSDVPFTHAFHSSLQRSKQTIQSFLDTGIPSEGLQGLDEFGWGLHEGQQYSPQTAGFYPEMVQQWLSGNLDYAVEGGESPNEVAVRLREAMAYILGKVAAGPVLICMHGRAMRLLLCLLTGTHPSRMEDFLHSNTSLYVLEGEEMGEFKVLVANSLNHLDV